MSKIHWSFWLPGIIALVWNALGCMNYIMQTNPEMLANYPEVARKLVVVRRCGSLVEFEDYASQGLDQLAAFSTTSYFG